MILESFLLNFYKKNTFTERDAFSYLKVNGTTDFSLIDNPRNCPILHKEIQNLQSCFYQYANTSLKHHKIAEYATLFFLKELKKNANCDSVTSNLLKTIQITFQFYIQQTESMEDIKNKINKENKRRNIQLDFSEKDQNMLSYEPMSIEIIDEFYRKEMNLCERKLIGLNFEDELNLGCGGYMCRNIDTCSTVPNSLDLDYLGYNNNKLNIIGMEID